MTKVNLNDIITAVDRQDSATSRYLATQEDKLQAIGKEVFGKEYTLPQYEPSNAWANFGDLNVPPFQRLIRQDRTRVKRRKAVVRRNVDLAE